jgi:Zn-dependent protease
LALSFGFAESFDALGTDLLGLAFDRHLLKVKFLPVLCGDVGVAALCACESAAGAEITYLSHDLQITNLGIGPGDSQLFQGYHKRNYETMGFLGILFQSPITFIAFAIAIVLAIAVHEFAHAWASNALGDPTAKNEGRLTVNPLRHLDPLGTLMLFFVGFGWGKPVPFNPYNLKSQKWGPALIAIAGPFSNLLMALTFGLAGWVIASFTAIPGSSALFTFFGAMVLINLILMVFNLIPIPPLDGSKILFAALPEKHENFKYTLTRYGPIILLVLILADSFMGFSIFSSLFGWVFSLAEGLFTF